MAKRLLSRMTSAPANEPPKREIAYRIIYCPLFQHQKHTDACTALRAKGVCRMQCHSYFQFAGENAESVEKIIAKNKAMIDDHRRRHDLPTDIDYVEYVMPKGDFLCKYCGKSFVHEGRLENHLDQKHRRMIHEEKEQEKARKEREAERKRLLGNSNDDPDGDKARGGKKLSGGRGASPKAGAAGSPKRTGGARVIGVRKPHVQAHRGVSRVKSKSETKQGGKSR